MNRLICATILSAVLLTHLAVAQSTPQFFPGTGHWYQLVTSPNVTWTQAKDAAAASGGYLACINSQAENDFVLGLTPPPPAAWIGGTDQGAEGNWQWISGEPWSFTHWGSNEPSNGGGLIEEDFLEIWTSDNHLFLDPGDWNDDSTPLPSYVIEYNSDPSSSCAGNALLFDGANDEVVIPDDASMRFSTTQPMTVECWFRLNEAPGTIHILGRTNCSSWLNYQIAISADQLLFYAPDGNAVSTPFTPVIEQWYHVAGTDDGTTPHLFLNGVEQGTLTSFSPQNDPAPFKIGGSGNCQHLKGQIDEVRLWNVARTVAEVNASMHQSVPCNSAGLVGYWNFDEAIGDQQVLDCSSAGNNGTLGASSGFESDDPVRVVSTAPILGDCADQDGDGILDSEDNCISISNPLQEDSDADGIGDSCDVCTDTDNDGFGNPGFPNNTCQLDNCPTTANHLQTDTDSDGIGDVCDECTDTDGDGFGNPGFSNNTCPSDNCPSKYNPLQEDRNNNGIGDSCDVSAYFYVDSITVGLRYTIVCLDNAESVAGLQVPLKYNWPYGIDSVSRVGCRTADWEQWQAPVNTVNKTVLIGGSSNFGGGTTCMEPGDGAIAKIFWKIGVECVDLDSTLLDTTFVQPSGELLITECEPGSPEFTPGFVQAFSRFSLFACGDATGNGKINISDAVMLINYIFAGGVAPSPVCSGDADCSGIVTISDAVFLINYVFAGGPAPCSACP